MAKLLDAFNARISGTLKKLLETKHLYQSETLNFDDLVTEDLKEEFLKGIGTDWDTQDHWFANHIGLPDTPLVKKFDLKLFCATCKRLEAFNPVNAHCLVRGYYDYSQPIQVFAFSFLCQSCKSAPEVFIVRREKLKLTLCGRAPIEHSVVPPPIPKQVQELYRRGITAFQSGEVLAGNFLLRTVIEQWARLATGLETVTKADIIMDTYMDSLPKHFKDHFPSMRDLYAALSADIHGAVGSSDLFERARAEIVRHFEARRVFELA